MGEQPPNRTAMEVHGTVARRWLQKAEIAFGSNHMHAAKFAQAGHVDYSLIRLMFSKTCSAPPRGVER